MHLSCAQRESCPRLWSRGFLGQSGDAVTSTQPVVGGTDSPEALPDWMIWMMCLMRRQIEIEAFFGGATWNVSELESGMSASSYPVLHLCTIILPVGHRNRFYPADQDRVMIPYTVTTVVLRFNDLLRDTVVLMFHLSGNARCNSHFTKGNVFPLGALAGATALACCVTHKRVGRVDPSKIHHVGRQNTGPKIFLVRFSPKPSTRKNAAAAAAADPYADAPVQEGRLDEGLVGHHGSIS